MKRADYNIQLEFLAASQWGMFTSAQAQELGLTRHQISRLLDSGRIEKLSYGVYKYIIDQSSDFDYVKAAWLSIFPKETATSRLNKRPYDAVVAGPTAAYMLGAGDLYPQPYTFLTLKRKQSTRTDIRLLSAKYDESDVQIVDSLPVTTFERTVFDLIRLGTDPSLVDQFMRDASTIHDHDFDLQRLADLLSSISRSHGYKPRDGFSFALDLIVRNTFDNRADRVEDILSNSVLPLILNNSDTDRDSTIDKTFSKILKFMNSLYKYSPDYLSMKSIQQMLNDLPDGFAEYVSAPTSTADYYSLVHPGHWNETTLSSSSI